LSNVPHPRQCLITRTLHDLEVTYLDTRDLTREKQAMEIENGRMWIGEGKKKGRSIQ